MTAMPQPRTCPLPGCPRALGKGKLMCSRCWSAVPPDLQRLVHRTYRAWLRDLGNADLMHAYRDASNAALRAV